MKKYLTINEVYICAYKFLSSLYFQNLDGFLVVDRQKFGW